MARRARPGEAVCGDLEVVAVFPDGTLVGVVDGLGSAEESAVAAKTAVVRLKRYAKETVISLVKRCDRVLMMTHGAAMTLASFRGSEHTLSWLGVGNVEGMLLRADPTAKPARERLRLYEGVVGYHHIPVLQESCLGVQPGDTLVLASDGIQGDFAQAVDLRTPPQPMAEAILQKHFKGTDDALVLVARYVGRNHEHHSG
ncbi:MAG TPA: SpoIIE family protein phosphatase [Bacillota bacterium]|nr:SpoIIE family protein phosphatase [Bacillota bacterium]